jgi:serine/threonine-protein phosphatase 6 regulatory subunit 3
LTGKITSAQRRNDFEVEQQKGIRLGFMGHITYISEEVCKLMEKCGPELSAELACYFEDEVWLEYRHGIFRETKDRDRQPLGGIRPNATHHPLGAMGKDESDGPIQRNKVINGGVVPESDDDEEEGVEGTEAILPSEGDVSNDQFARYLCQQILNDFPTGFDFSEGYTEAVEDCGWEGKEVGVVEERDMEDGGAGNVGDVEELVKSVEKKLYIQE